MNTLEFLSELRHLGIQISTDGDKLRCNAPKDVLTSQLRSELAERKAEIIALLQNNNSPEKSTPSRIQSASRNQSLPLSFAQQRLWFLDQLESNSSFYNLPEAMRFQGELKIDILQQALDEIVVHHEILRTNYIAKNGNPIQSIAEPRPVKLKIIDLQQYEVVEQEIQIQKVLQQESQFPFNLASDLMIRGCLLKLSSSEQILLLVQHHIASDGWSMGILWEQLTQLYLAFLEGKPNPLPKLPIQYVDYAVWQRKWLSSEVIERQLNYWKKQLANANPLLELPTDHPRPSVQTYRGARQTHKLSPSLSAAINQLCRQEGVTLYMTLLAAFQVLMHRYSRQEDIMVGSAIAGRNQIEVEELIGFFVNTLILRNDLSGNPSFKELLSKVRSTTLDAYAHQDLPFEKLVEELNPERSLSYSPLFQVMFVLQNTPTQTEKLLGLDTKLVRIETSTAKFDLDLSVEEKGDGLIASWTYNIDLFDAATIERMREHFQILLEGIVANPNQPIDHLPMLTEKERQQLLIEWNNTSTDYPQNKCIHQLVEEQVELTPDAIAVIFQERQLTYRELNNRANQLAHYLQKLGVRNDALVGICVERSLEMVVGLLGILKAGCAYVPLDPTYPQERLHFMLQDTQVSVLLTNQSLVTELPEYDAQLVLLDADWDKIEQEKQENLIPEVSPESLGYVIYTSGSTGKPKGVPMTQIALYNLILWQLRNTTIFAQAKTLQFSPISFDVSFQEIFSTWCAGGTLVLIGEEMRRDARALLSLLKEQAVERLFLPFVALQQLAEVAQVSGLVPDHLQDIITAGEQLQITPAITYLFTNLPNARLHNHYGPSESHVVTAFTLNGSVETWSPLPPIGRAIANTHIFILDSHLQPVPIGIPGELYIGGVCLARGYLNRPELTAEKFIPNPFSHEKVPYLYKTGDLVRYLRSGDIEYLGRIDNQVKIRGFRIELGEVESTLCQHPSVQTAVVIPREDIPGNKRLVAYIVPKLEQKPTITELRNFLKLKLASYMIPSSFIMMEVLPLTPSGKLDRRALPAPDLSSFQLDAEFVPPKNPTEELLAKIWTDILGVERVGVNDNFFALGGHSLLSVRLVSEIEKAFNFQIPLSSLFKISTIAEIAELICDKKPLETIDEQEMSLGLSLDDYRALLSHSAGKVGLRLGKRGLIINILPDSQTTSQPFIWIGEVRTGKKLNLKRPLYVMPGASLSTSMNSYNDYISVIASLLVDELLSVSSCESYALGGWCYNGLVALEMAQRLRKLGKKVDLVTLIDSDSLGVSKIYRFAHKINFYLGTIRFHLFKLSKLSLTDKWDYIMSRLKPSENNFNDHNLKNNADDTKFEFDQEAFNVLSKAVVDYKPKAYRGKVLLVIGTEQIVYGEKDVKYFDLSWLFPYCGWGNILCGEVHVSNIKCDHLELMEDPYCEQVGVAIQKAESLL